MLRGFTRFFFIMILCSLISPTTIFAATSKLIVHNARIFTMAHDQRHSLRGYMVIAADGTIIKVAAGTPPRTLKAKNMLDAQGYWIIPGFISAHSHFWQAAYHGLAKNKNLSGWINDLYRQKASKDMPEDFYWFSLLGALDHLEHGITTAYNFNYGGTLQKNSGNSFDEAQFHAETQSGIRFVHGYQPETINKDITMASARNRLKKFIAWIELQPQSAKFFSVMINGMTAFNTTYQQAVMEARLMHEFHIGNQSHYLEAPNTQNEERAKFVWFIDSGLLAKNLIFGHFIHTNEDILQQAAKAGAVMSWNPLSNGRLASGVADIPKYLNMGIRVGMGVDGEASADVADPFENMRVGLYSIRDKYEHAKVMTPYQVLWFHTMGSAEVLGIKNKVGSLEPGKFADFLMINPTRLGVVLEDPYANLVFTASARDIDQVYVGGELIVAHGKMMHQDLQNIQIEVNKRVLAALTKTAARH